LKIPKLNIVKQIVEVKGQQSMSPKHCLRVMIRQKHIPLKNLKSSKILRILFIIYYRASEVGSSHSPLQRKKINKKIVKRRSARKSKREIDTNE
jgi:hypothetical protein